MRPRGFLQYPPFEIDKYIQDRLIDAVPCFSRPTLRESEGMARGRDSVGHLPPTRPLPKQIAIDRELSTTSSFRPQMLGVALTHVLPLGSCRRFWRTQTGRDYLACLTCHWPSNSGDVDPIGFIFNAPLASLELYTPTTNILHISHFWSSHMTLYILYLYFYFMLALSNHILVFLALELQGSCICFPTCLVFMLGVSFSPNWPTFVVTQGH